MSGNKRADILAREGAHWDQIEHLVTFHKQRRSLSSRVLKKNASQLWDTYNLHCTTQVNIFCIRICLNRFNIHTDIGSITVLHMWTAPLAVKHLQDCHTFFNSSLNNGPHRQTSTLLWYYCCSNVTRLSCTKAKSRAYSYRKHDVKANAKHKSANLKYKANQ